MDTGRELGFVVRQFFPRQQKICVVFQNHGKVALVVKDPLLCHRLKPGMLVSCSLLSPRQQGLFAVATCEIIGFFACHTHEEVLWLHHMLELVYYFSPLNNPCPEIFFFLMMYFKLFHQISFCTQLQHAFFLSSLVKLLAFFDFQPTNSVAPCADFFDYLLANSIDFDLSQNIESIRKCLQAIPKKVFHDARLWGLMCIKSHPQFVSFKTAGILQ